MTTRRKKTSPITEVQVSKINELLPNRVRLKCKNVKQKDYYNLIRNNEIVVCAGPAGVGKSYVAIAAAIELLQLKTTPYDKIVLINPAVEAEEKLGFMPGDMREKLGPYVDSSLDIIDKIIGKPIRLQLEEDGTIGVGGLGFIRGKSIDNTVLVMEEAQNMSPNQMKTLLTRIGENTKFIISGDLDQSDKYNDVKSSGLYDAMDRLRGVSEIGFFKFELSDIVRNPIISKILECYLPKKIKVSTITAATPTLIIENDISEIETIMTKDFEASKDNWTPVANIDPKEGKITTWFKKRFK
jgi:phosphate starvation-inducible PhoH-like protein|tara:strand:+ start:3315 stop:4208 length:894 start_codon:yes stop_codon:yes gene_type:complete